MLTVEEVPRLIAAAQNLTDRTMLMVLYLDGHAQCGAAPSADRRHRQSAHADSHSAREGRTRSVCPAECHAAGDAPRALAVDAAEDVVISREPCTTGAPTGRSPRRSCGMPVATPRRRAELEKRVSPHLLAAFVRHASARSGGRPAHRAALARPCRSRAYGHVSPPLPAPSAGGGQSARCDGDSGADTVATSRRLHKR